MKPFNKYQFLTELENELTEQAAFFYSCELGECEIKDNLFDVTQHYIANKCVYYSDCWAICVELGKTDFTIEQTGETAKDICQLAYWALYELAQDINLDEIVQSLETNA